MALDIKEAKELLGQLGLVNIEEETGSILADYEKEVVLIDDTLWEWLRPLLVELLASRPPPSPGKLGDVGIRDPSAVCVDYDPRERTSWRSAGQCETDGHYLCRGCIHRKLSEET